jgi:hypothetical protein
MKKAAVAGGAVATALLLLALAVGYRMLEPGADGSPSTSPAIPSSAAAGGEAGGETDQGFLYGRVTTHGGTTYEGRLRWGGGEEAFWGDYFNGEKEGNPWAAHVPPERLTESRPIEIFGLQIAERQRPIALDRLFMARFGDVARIEARGREVRVTLKSGTEFVLDRLEASDFDDGVRVWDGERGVVDLDSLEIRTIELLPTARLGAVPERLHGIVRTRQGDFTGFVQWNREEGVGSDELVGLGADGPLAVRFDTVRSIARRSQDSSLVTLRDGRELVLSGTPEVGEGNRGVYVDDPPYGRVLVSWEAFERLDMSDLGAHGSGPGYHDLPPGSPLAGSVTTRDGRRLAGRLVYDLDESETTETLDAPSRGVHYTIPFGLVASIDLRRGESRDARHARVALHSGEELQLERAGDLGERNAGVLIFVDGRERPEYVAWSDVEQIDLDRSPAMYPPFVEL